MNYFNEADFRCRCGCGQAIVHHELLNMLNVARWKAGIPFFVKSGYRCKPHNTKIGGALTSAHLKGLAADIATKSSTARMQIIAGLIYAGFTRIGIAQLFVHVDMDTEKVHNVMWLYPETEEVFNGQTA